MQAADAVLYRREDAVGIVTLNRPDNRNSMTSELLAAFDKVIAQVLSDRRVRVVVITGSGTSFCAGADFRDVVQRGDASLPAADRSYAMYEPFLRVLDFDVPVIAAMNGHAVGGGFGLALLADIRVANCAAKYGANFARLGLHPGMAVTYLLPRVAGIGVASELLYTGALIDGRRAHELGLVNHAVDAAHVLSRAMELAREIAANAPIAIAMTKQSLRRQEPDNIRAAAWQEAAAQAQTLATQDAAEGMQAILDKRSPRFHGR